MDERQRTDGERMRKRWLIAALALAGGVVCAAADAEAGKADAPVPSETVALMAERGTSLRAPILMRLYKKESELEVWKKAGNGRYVLLKSFPICRWSGQLGPKRRQGDRQAPEGFYTIAPGQMNPNSAYYLSFNLGYPNAYDRAHGGSGSALMVHGTCSSAGCYAMTDKQIGEIYALAREAFAGGQKAFQFQAFPFRMTARNMARHRNDPNIAFWRQLKEGADRFEATGDEPLVGVAGARYVFPAFANPVKEAAAKERIATEERKVAGLVDDGSAAVRTTYSDGAQHPSFRNVRLAALGMVSRPEAIPLAGREVVLIPERRKPAPVVVATQTETVEPSLFDPATPMRLTVSVAVVSGGSLQVASNTPLTASGGR